MSTCINRKKEEIIYSPNNNVIPKNSINVHRIPGSDYDRGTKTIREIEVLTDIKLKVYWEPKQFVNVGNIQIPEGVIQTICFIKDLPQILRAKALIVHKDIKDYKELRFERMGEFTPMGLQQDRYFACMWKRI